MLITRKSTYSGQIRTIDLPVTEQQMDDFENRRERKLLIQHIFPDLPEDQREFILTGITGDEWDELFPPEDEEEPEDVNLENYFKDIF